MMSYRDMTFCKGDGCTRYGVCHRALTPDIERRAEKWWGGPGAPISTFAEPKQLVCYTKEIIPTKEEKEP